MKENELLINNLLCFTSYQRQFSAVKLLAPNLRILTSAEVFVFKISVFEHFDLAFREASYKNKLGRCDNKWNWKYLRNTRKTFVKYTLKIHFWKITHFWKTHFWKIRAWKVLVKSCVLIKSLKGHMYVGSFLKGFL